MRPSKKLILIVAVVLLLVSIGIFFLIKKSQDEEISIQPAGEINLSDIKGIDTQGNAFIADTLQKQITREDDDKDNVVGDAVVRQETYVKKRVFDGMETTFLVDIEAAQRTYRVIIYSHDEDSMDVVVRCASEAERRYNNEGCKDFKSW